MNFDPVTFMTEFRIALDDSRGRELVGKTYNADDTLRVFEAADKACRAQPEYFPDEGKSFWNSPQKSREFLCDYTFHDANHCILFALESEWGVLASPSRTTEAVVYDFTKIINMGSPIKAMVFAYVDKANEKATLDEMAGIVTNWPQDRLGTLMAFACPWHDELHGETVTGYLWQQGAWQPVEAYRRKAVTA